MHIEKMVYTLNCKGKLISLDKPIVMGIINCTPDSFYADSRMLNTDAIVHKATAMYNAGSSILDLGGQSTRPGSVHISAAEEMERVLPAIEAVHKTLPEAIISIDTFYASVAGNAITAGASIVNDISGGQYDDAMLTTVAAEKVPFICMHIKGSPQSMQANTNYEDMLTEMIDYFIKRLAICKTAGITDVVIDPGFGFAKNVEQNFFLLKHLSAFHILDRPILAGLSRKSMIYKTLKISADAALNGSTVLQTMALLNGANILRVHDVAEAVETIQLVEAYLYAKASN